ncbi:MAG TPA: class I SAM-dependent methyltransferase [Candidatus Paceibacterota bacterium]|nr:class I SAM-dependent methyltransferase [Candidatus Paceibacterota bacterium]
MDNSFNHGVYSSESAAKQWVEWTKTFDKTDTRNIFLYPRLSKWVAKINPKTLLEIGSGSGLCSEKIAIGGSEYIGVEPSAALRRYAKETYPDRKFLPGLAEDLPFKDASFDAAFSMFVWLHIKAIQKAAQELFRVLKPGGSFIIVTANPDEYSLWRSWHSNIREVDGNAIVGNMPKFANHLMYLYTLDELKLSLTDAGLTILSIESFSSKQEPEKKFVVLIEGVKSAKI